MGLTVNRNGEGRYFSHGGSNWCFRCKLTGHLLKGYGVVVMTNGDNGAAIMTEIEARAAAAYSWDSLDKPIAR